jgi:hypothetical protein
MCMYINCVIAYFRCGEAIQQNDLKMATQIITKLRELSSPNGNGVQRMAHYVTNALVKYHKMIDKMIKIFENQFHASCYNHARWTLSVGSVYI